MKGLIENRGSVWSILCLNLAAFLFCLCLTNPLLASGKKPEKEQKSPPVKQQLKDDLKAANDGANKALDSVDKGVHKLIKDFNDSGKKN